MSTSSGYSSAKTPAPWRSRFLEHVQHKMQSPEFVFSTLHPAPAGSSFPHVPHARYCIFRGMWAELPENKHNEAQKNERVFESDMPTLTSDVRMEKIPELFASSANQNGQESVLGCGGGGPVEAVWWVKDVMTQWRIRGDAFIVGPDVEDFGSESNGSKILKTEVSKRMRVVMPGSEKDWSWDTELTAHFGNVSPTMRGSFKQPPPGRPIDQPYNHQEEKMGAKINDLHDPVSRKHFRVVIIRPQEVEETPGAPRVFGLNSQPDPGYKKSWKILLKI